MPGDSEVENRQIVEAEDFGEALTPELREQEERSRAGGGAVKRGGTRPSYGATTV